MRIFRRERKVTECAACKVRRRALELQASHLKGATIEEKWAYLDRTLHWYRNSYNRAWTLVKKYRTQHELWHGKYLVVKHENNKLRQALYRREKAAKETVEV